MHHDLFNNVKMEKRQYTQIDLYEYNTTLVENVLRYPTEVPEYLNDI
jgi:hypothetical protein